MKKEKKGVLLIALGHAYYGRMAYTLASSIRHTCPDVNIHLVSTESSLAHLNESQLDVFNTISEAPYDSYHRKGNLEYIKSKTWMYNLSPFDTTIFLDVDMIWLTKKSINSLFEELKDVDYTVQNRDFVELSDPALNAGYSQWADVTEIKEQYKFKKGRYYSLHSEFVYFKKNQKNKLFFNEWIKQYDHLKVKHATFANGIPDELPLSIATVIHQQYPHKDAFLPIYWERAEKPLNRPELISNYYGYSIGGNHLTTTQKNTYNDFANYYANQKGSNVVFKTDSKTKFLTERSNF